MLPTRQGVGPTAHDVPVSGSMKLTRSRAMQTRQTPSGLEGSSGRHRLHVPRGSLVYFLSEIALPTRTCQGLRAEHGVD